MLFRSFLFLVFVASSSVSSAAVVSYSYTGEWLDGDATIVGIFGYDDAVVDSESAPNEGVYSGAGFWTGVVSGGEQDGANFSFNNLDVVVYNDDADFDDELWLNNGTASTSYFDLVDTSRTVFSDDSLPSFLTIDDFDGLDILLGSEFGGSGEGLQYEVTSINPVPVPPAIWLFGSAILGFIGWSRNKKQPV